MNDVPAQRAAPARDARNWTIFLALSAYLIASFLWRSLVIAHESVRPAERLLTIGLDVLAIVGLIGMHILVSRGRIVFWVALTAGVGLLAYRFLNGETGWWAGHLAFKLCPRVGIDIVCSCRDQIALGWLCP